MLVCGIDEAGRGPLIGPMVLCGILIEEKRISELKRIGVKDSKQLTPRQRENLLPKILSVIRDHKVIIVPPAEIDNAVFSRTSNLNKLEMEKMAVIINELGPDVAYVDCPSTNIKGFTRKLERKLEKKVKLVAEHKADERYVVVGAASIIAKVMRDSEIERIKEEIGIDFGSGYPSDPRTVRFAEENYDKYGFIRKSWNIQMKQGQGKDQKKLTDF